MTEEEAEAGDRVLEEAAAVDEAVTIAAIPVTYLETVPNNVNHVPMAATTDGEHRPAEEEAAVVAQAAAADLATTAVARDTFRANVPRPGSPEAETPTMADGVPAEELALVQAVEAAEAATTVANQDTSQENAPSPRREQVAAALVEVATIAVARDTFHAIVLSLGSLAKMADDLSEAGTR